MVEAMIGVLGGLLVALVVLMLKRLSELDTKLDKHISKSEDFRAAVRVLQDRWDRS